MKMIVNGTKLQRSFFSYTAYASINIVEIHICIIDHLEAHTLYPMYKNDSRYYLGTVKRDRVL